jgi:hypothetical protein
LLRLFNTYQVGRRAVSQDLLSFQDLNSPKASEGKNVLLHPKVNAVGKVHYLQSLTVLIIIIGIMDSELRFKRKIIKIGDERSCIAGLQKKKKKGYCRYILSYAISIL